MSSNKSKLQSANIKMLAHNDELRKQIKAQTRKAFKELEIALMKIIDTYNPEMPTDAKLKLIHPSDKVLQFTVDDDTLIFVMQPGVYEFDRNHKAMEAPYIAEDIERASVGIINIYDFLTDSFTYDRDEDEGYLIARVFINKDNAFFVEGKRQRNMGFSSYGKSELNEDNWVKIVETSIKYVCEMNALVPPYETQMVTTLGQMMMEILKQKSKNGKRLGFRFRADDI